MSEQDVVRLLSENITKIGVKQYLFFCPGCRKIHVFKTPKWGFNGDLVKPTLTGSYLCYENKAYREASKDRYGHRCHSFITDGQIEFLNDCTHDLKGQTVQLPSLEKKLGEP
jgi:hypothetical protein